MAWPDGTSHRTGRGRVPCGSRGQAYLRERQKSSQAKAESQGAWLRMTAGVRSVLPMKAYESRAWRLIPVWAIEKGVGWMHSKPQARTDCGGLPAPGDRDPRRIGIATQDFAGWSM